MSAITTHVLDTATGRPAAGLEVQLEFQEAHGWSAAGTGVTDADGRIRTLLTAGTSPAPGTYRLVFNTGDYFARIGTPSAFYPHVIVVFQVVGGSAHYHVPLLLSPFGYSTYRGS